MITPQLPNPAPAALLAPHPSLNWIPTRDQLVQRQLALDNHNADWREKYEELENSWLTLCGSIREYGVKEPVKIIFEDGKPLVVDGRNRLAAARTEGVLVPWVEIPATQMDQEVETSLFHRNHFSEFTRCYIAIRQHPNVLQSKVGKRRRPSDLYRANWHDINTQQELCERYNFSLRTLKRAIALVRDIDSGKISRVAFEWRIFTGWELQQAKAAAAVTDDVTNGTTSLDRQTANFRERCGGLFTLLRETWQKEELKPEQKQDMILSTAKFLILAGDDFRSLVLRTVKEGLPPGWEGWQRQEESKARTASKTIRKNCIAAIAEAKAYD